MRLRLLFHKKHAATLIPGSAKSQLNGGKHQKQTGEKSPQPDQITFISFWIQIQE